MELRGQQFGQLARGGLLVTLKFTDAHDRAADQLRQCGLSQIERFAPPFEPDAESGDVIHQRPARADHGLDHFLDH